MDADLPSRAVQLAGEISTHARTAGDVNGLMRLMMKAAWERMLNTELDVHLGGGPVSRPRRSRLNRQHATSGLSTQSCQGLAYRLLGFQGG